MDNQEFLRKWHEDENIWWDEHGEYMTFQWKLNPLLNQIIRSDLESDFTEFLFKPEGNLLDLGCGSGWLSLHFAEKGMSVLGIDFSQEQIEAANKLKLTKNLTNAAFECCDLVHWDCGKYREEFDSVLIYAFLHHLPPVEINEILKKVEYVVKQGGRVYIYEPIIESSAQADIYLSLLDYVLRLCQGLLLRFPNWLGLWDARYRKEIARGYSMASPHESPVEFDLIGKSSFKSMTVEDVKGWHLFSIGFAMQTMSLQESIRGIYVQFARFWQWIDNALFKIFDWKDFSRPQRFILCGVKLVKR